MTVNGGIVAAESNNGNYYAACAYGSLTVNGGVLDAQNTETPENSISTTVFTLGHKNANDSISFGGVYADTAKIASRKKFNDGMNTYDSNTTSNVLTALKNVTLTPVTLQ